MTPVLVEPVLVEVDRIDALMARLDEIAAHLERVDALLTRYEPIIEAYLDPAASGPLAWAVRRKMK